MYLDSLLELCSDQALTGTSLVASENTIDFGSDRDMAPGRPMWIVLISKVAPTGTSPTLTVAQQTDDNSGFSSAATLVSQTFTGAQLEAGSIHVIPMAMTNERHFRLGLTPGGTSPTFTIDAYLTDQEPRNLQAYPDAI